MICKISKESRSLYPIFCYIYNVRIFKFINLFIRHILYIIMIYFVQKKMYIVLFLWIKLLIIYYEEYLPKRKNTRLFNRKNIFEIDGYFQT